MSVPSHILIETLLYVPIVLYVVVRVSEESNTYQTEQASLVDFLPFPSY